MGTVIFGTRPEARSEPALTQTTRTRARASCPAYLAFMCVLTLGFGSACTSVVYKSEARRGDLLRTVPTGGPEATGKVSLAWRSRIRDGHKLDLAVARVTERHRPVRREYEQQEVDYRASQTVGNAVIGEIANLFATLGLGHLMLNDWHFGLPKTFCLGEGNAPNGRSSCEYTEKVRVVEGTEVEQVFEIIDPSVTISELAGTRLSMKMIRTSRADMKPIEQSGGFDARGRATLDLRKIVPQDERRALLKISADLPDVDAAVLDAVVVRTNEGFRIDTSDVALADAREAIRAAEQVWEVEVARREAAKEEAKRRAAAEKREKQERARQKKIAKICPKGVGDVGDLISTNPYDVKGKCFAFVGEKLQILSRTVGLYRLGSDLVYYINFGSDSAPGILYQGYVRGVGIYQYETVMGASKIVPSFVPIELPAEVPANSAD